MTFAVCLAVTMLICLTFDKAIKKYPQFFYIGAVLLSVATYCINEFVEVRTLPTFARDYLVPVLTNALLATSFWTVVMFTGALKNGSKLIKKLMPIRGELSIISALLTVGHIIIYGITYLKRLFSGRNLTFDTFRHSRIDTCFNNDTFNSNFRKEDTEKIQGQNLEKYTKIRLYLLRYDISSCNTRVMVKGTAWRYDEIY